MFRSGMPFDRLKRREFITLVGGATAWPLATRAQQSVPIRPLIGMLPPLSATAASHNMSAFRSAMRDLGYVEGRNATLEVRYGDGSLDRLALLVAELVALKPDVLFTGGKAGALAAQLATKTIPIVIVTPEDPLVSGLANTIARPGGNVTGTWLLGDDALVGKRLELLRLAVPSVARIGLVANPDDPSDRLTVSQLPAAAHALDMAFNVFEVRDVARLDMVSAQIMRAGVQALVVGPGPTFFSPEIAAFAARLRLPAMYAFRYFVDVGGLLSYGPNLPDVYRQSARLVARILKGERPADLPIELPTRYELIVNLKTAKALGLTISDSFVLLADEVIE
jgi:putative tryptophan/tyrosine transport system substrate-binding protein